MTRFRCVTTMHHAGWIETGERMVSSFLRNWPAEASLTIYAEDFTPEVDGIALRRLPAWLDEFKARHRDNPAANGRSGPTYDYRRDCLKFAHKVAALTDYALGLDDGVMIWLDADTFTHSAVTPQWLDALFPEPSYLAWLDRFNNHPECGFVFFRPGHRSHRDFMERFSGFYRSDKVLGFRETHDSFVLQRLVEEWYPAGKIERPVSLSGEARTNCHPMANGPLSTKMDHLKGQRKQIGRTPKRERSVRDGVAYWL